MRKVFMCDLFPTKKIYDHIYQDLDLKGRSSNDITNVMSPKIFRLKVMDGNLNFIPKFKKKCFNVNNNSSKDNKIK